MNTELNKCKMLLKHAHEEIEELKKDAAKSERRAVAFSSALHNHILAMQSATIAAEMDGSRAGMAWIYNTLIGPGNMPGIEYAKSIGGAQAWFDEKTKDEEIRIASISLRISNEAA